MSEQPEPMGTPKERLADALYRDYEFTHHAPHDMTGGPAITEHLLYTVRQEGRSVLDALDAAESEIDRLRARLDEAETVVEAARDLNCTSDSCGEDLGCVVRRVRL